MNRLLLIFFLLTSFYSQAQIITLFAGNGGGFGGDGGPATAAGLPDPGGGIFDRYGNYYFVDLGAKRIRKIDASGIITTVAGNGFGGSTGDGSPATAARLNAPSAVKLDTSGNLLIADGGNNNIRKVDIISGIISTIAGTGTAAYGGDNGPAAAASLNDPQDIAIDKWNNIYIGDVFNFRVRKINSSGFITTFAGTGTEGFTGDGGQATVAEISGVTGMSVDTAGNLYIADQFIGQRVRKIDITGIITTVAGNGGYIYGGDGMPATDAQINPIKVALDSVSNIYISDKYNLRIFKVDGSGIIHCVAGNGVLGFSGDGGPATAAEFNYPSGVALDACGNLYIAETGTLSTPDSANIRKVTFNPTCDPYSDHFDSASLAIKTIINNEVHIYPNPVYSEITIKVNNKIDQITITNLIGQTVYSQACDLEKAEVNIAGLPEGVYIVKVKDNEGNVTTNKIIKENVK